MRTWLVSLLAVSAIISGAVAWWAGSRPRVGPPPRPESWAGAERLVRAQIESRLDAVESRPRSPAAWLDLAFAYHANDLVDLAGPCYEQALTLDGDDPRAWYLLARLRSELGDVAGAVAAADRAAALDDAAAFVQWRRGFWLFELGRIDEAEAAFERAQRLDPADPVATIGLARVASQRGDPQRVVTLLTPLARDDLTPNLLYVRHLLGTAWQQLGETARARTLLARRPQSSLSWADPWTDQLAAHRRLETWIVRQAQALIGQGQPEAALVHLQPLLPERADDPVLLRTMGHAHFVAGDIAAAIDALERVVARAPDDFTALVNLAYAYERQGAIEQALAALERAEAVEPGRPEVAAARTRLRSDR